MEEIFQVMIKFLDGKHKTLNFITSTIPIISIKSRIHEISGIPISDQLLMSNGKTLDDNETLIRLDEKSQSFPTVHLLLRLRGGKGGFGSLLRGNPTNKKKTVNFDACRDMSGRRLRNVNTEKKLDEWNAGKKDRELEKMAEDYLKMRAKMAKKSGQGSGGDGGAEKYVEKYRKDSAKCMEEVDKSVRESLSSGFKRKRKGVAREGDKSKSKTFQIWRGKKKVYDSETDNDSEVEDDESDDDLVEETEKSVVINIENHLDSNKAADGSSGSINGGKLYGDTSIGHSTESGSEEEKETIPDGEFRTFQNSDSCLLSDEMKISNKAIIENHELSRVQDKDSDVTVVSKYEALQSELGLSIKATIVNVVDESFCQVSSIASVQEVGFFSKGEGNADIKSVVDVEAVAAKSDDPDSEKPLNFDDYSSATEMEVLGLERLKSELQTRGLKCGGTLQERAGRLFLLKTIPLEKLPKKLLAK